MCGKYHYYCSLCLVSISELMQTPSQRHVIPLQGRPYEQDTVTGLLTIEFVFKDCGSSWAEGEVAVPGVHRTFEAVEGRDVINKKTVYSRQESCMADSRPGSRVAQMALKDIKINKAMRSGGSQPLKTTLLMHQVRTVSERISSYLF